ncbi:unnamed protein product [Mytilus edulis]|uniref:Phosphatidic acid phosphatase type 2/haloperoxidase domain-containing protein n=1 Tax=Mytilus edulis TaxID=6550 RepID=A0A8S3U665_MYTED|nr:unnamed protein product [Mytilus edulis]
MNAFEIVYIDLLQHVSYQTGSLGYIDYNIPGRAMVEPEPDDEEAQEVKSTPEVSTRWNCTIMITVIIEVIILAVVCILEYFLRFTTVFPIRKVNFSCTDNDIRYSTSQEAGLTFDMQIPEALIYILVFCLPIGIILLTETGIWAFVSDKKKSLKAGRLKFMQVIRRVIRFSGVFLFGILSLMIYVDITKLMTGRLVPSFLEVCKPNMTQCTIQSNYGGDELCTQTDEIKLRLARSSFPSLYSAMTTFSSVFIVLYFHRALKSHSGRIFRPFLSFIFLMLALVCGLWEIRTYRCHWTDVVVGYTIGLVLATYLGLVSLQYHKQRKDDDNIIQFFQQLIKDQEEENANMRMSRNRNLQRQKVIYSSPKTRWHRAVTTIQETRQNDPELYNSFQRDLSKGIDHFRDRRGYTY